MVISIEEDKLREIISDELKKRAVKPELVTAKQVAEMLQIGVTTVYELKSAGKIPASLSTLGRTNRWVRKEILDWIDAGSPNRQKWEAIKSCR